MHEIRLRILAASEKKSMRKEETERELVGGDWSANLVASRPSLYGGPACESSRQFFRLGRRLKLRRHGQQLCPRVDILQEPTAALARKRSDQHLGGKAARRRLAISPDGA